MAVYCLYLLMYLSPKLAGYLHTAASRHRRARYGGMARFAIGAACELVFYQLQFSITSLHVTGFIAALPFGKSTHWSGQVRDTRAVSWREASRAFWPQTLFGAAVHGALLTIAPSFELWALPVTLGYLAAIPFAVVTAHPGFGNWCARRGLCAVPEEYDPPAELIALSRGAATHPA
jgi:membrane glycosyltransferase